MKPLYKRVKKDIALVPQTINNSNATGKYYNMAMYRKALFVLHVGAMAATKTAKIEVLQATDAAGTGAKGIPSDAGQIATATITANTEVTECTLTLESVAAADIIKINGITFTAHANTTTAAKREYKIDGDDSADAAALAALINDATYGVPGVTATANANVITLKATEPGETVITISDQAATITPATTQASAFVEVDVSSLDINNGYQYLAAKVTSTANGLVAAGIDRSDARFEPDQKVGAYASV